MAAKNRSHTFCLTPQLFDASFGKSFWLENGWRSKEGGKKTLPLSKITMPRSLLKGSRLKDLPLLENAAIKSEVNSLYGWSNEGGHSKK